MSSVNRRNEAMIMVTVWCSVPLAALMYHTYAESTLMLWFAVIYSAVFFFTGLPVFMGHAGLLAGFNMMSPKEKRRYDIEKICRFVGISMFLIALATFYAALLFMRIGNELLLLGVLIVMPVAAVIAMFVVLNGKNFKHNVTVWDGGASEDENGKRYTKWLVVGAIIATVAIALAAVLLIGSGNVSVSMDDSELQVNAPMMNRSIDYEDIVHVEYRNSFDAGTRIGGFGGTNISSGNFENNEFGKYSLAAYNGVSAYIIVTPVSGKVLVFNLDTADRTLEFYNELLVKVTA